MKSPAKRLVLIWCLLIIGSALVIGRHLSSRRKESGEEIIKEEGKYRIEQKTLKEGFIRESGRSGYELNPEILPDPDTKVTIIIRLKNETSPMK